MNFDPRMSSVRQTPGHGGGRSRKEQEEDAFMTLPDREIAGCISDIGLNFSIADLQKPNPQQIQKVFEYLAEILMNSTRDSVAPAMKAAAEDTCGPYSEIFTTDTRDLMGFFVVLRKLLWETGIHDFTFSDVYRPTRERLVKIFSYIINFIRFRESQTNLIDEHFNKAEKTKQRIETLYSENQAKEEHLSELERNRKSTEAAIKDREARNKDLRSKLRELQDSENRDPLRNKLERLKEEAHNLRNTLEQKLTQVATVKQEAEKLRPYTTQSPAALEESLRDLNTSLNNDKAQVENLERRARALQTSCDSFSTVTADIKSCISLLNELSRDLSAEESTNAAASKNRDALSERSNNVRDVERQEKMLQKQLENVQRRTEKLRKQAEERNQNEQKRMGELKKVADDIRKERSERGREMERRRVRIEQTEKKMADLKENIENEIHSAHDQHVKLDSHIRLYINEMEQSISEHV